MACFEIVYNTGFTDTKGYSSTNYMAVIYCGLSLSLVGFG